MTDDDITRMVRDLNGVDLPAARVAALAPLVRDVNARAGDAALARLTIDATPWSHATLRAETAAGEKA
jgi:hypothetical protein